MELVKVIVLLLFMVCSKTSCFSNAGTGPLPIEAEPAITEEPAVMEVIMPELQIAQITDGLTMGDPNAPVKVIEFADYQCPGCGYYWSEMEPQIIADYIDTGKVFFTFVPFSFLGSYGTDPNWDESIKAAEAAYCANDQGAFWQYRAILFANQSGENEGAFSRDRLLTFADVSGLDYFVFMDCLDSGKYTQTVNDDYDFAVQQGSTFTPSFLIEDTIVDSSQLIDSIESSISQ